MKKKDAKRLKGPDQFQTSAMEGMNWLQENSALVVTIIVGLLVAAGGFAGYTHIQSGQAEERQAQLGEIRDVYDKEAKAADEKIGSIQKKINEIDTKIADAKKAHDEKHKDKKDSAPKFVADAKLTAEKAKLEKERDDIKADHSASRGQFMAYFNSHLEVPEGWAAGLMAARMLLSDKKLSEAQATLDKLLSHSKGQQFFQTQGRLMLIGIYEEGNEFAKALEQVDRLEKTVSKDLQPQVLLIRGRLQLLSKANDDAQKTLSTLIEKHRDSREADTARAMKALLN